MNCRLLVYALAFGLCTQVLALGAADQSQGLPTDAIPLDPDVQQEINRAVEALSAGEMPEAAAQEIVQEFKGFKNKPPQELLLQVLAVYGGKDEYRRNPRAEMAKRLLFSNLLQEMTPSDIVAVVAPKYEQVSDPKLEYGLRQALGMATLRGGRVDTGNPDFDAFSAHIAKNKEHPPRKLVGFMYGLNPKAAVLSMSRVYGDQQTEAELANLLKGDSKAALQPLAGRSEWWARLYVAEIMKKRPELRDSSILKKLENDDNPLVKKKVAEITSGK